MKLKVMSFNIRTCNDPNGHSVEERAPRVFKIIEDYDPDVFGLQEASYRWEPKLEPLNEKYDHIWMYRHDTSREATPLYWKRDAFELMEEEHFWLSETPEVCSKGWNADYYRICSFAALRHKESGKVFYFYNTHFDWVGSGPRESAQLIIRKAEKFGADAPVFCTADYNFTPNSFGWHSMRSYFYDAREALGLKATVTCHGYKDVDVNAGNPIDYCFYRGKGVAPTKYEVVTRTFDGKYPSDHFPVYFEFEVEE